MRKFLGLALAYGSMIAWAPDEGGAGGAGAGQAGAGGAGDAGAGAGAGAAAAGSGDGKPWYEGIQNEEIRTWAAAKNFPDIQTALDSHRNLEKLVGSDKLVMPKGDDDKEGWDRVHKALGRPDTPEGYKFQAPEGVELNKDLMGNFAKTAHELGIPQKAAQGLLNWYLQTQDAQGIQEAADLDAQADKDINALKTEWGKDYDANIEAGRRAARQFGIGEETMTKIEKAIGTKEMLSMFHRIGVGLGEDTAEGLEGGRPGFGLSKSQAQAKLAEIQSNAGYLDRSAPNHKALVAEAERLNKVILGIA